MKTKTYLKILSAMLFLSLFCNITHAEFFTPLPVPVDRLITNAEAYIQEYPKDANGYYVLGRIHYLAFANQTLELPATKKSDTEFEIPENYILNTLNMDKVQLGNRAYMLTLQEFGYRWSIISDEIIPEIPLDKKQKFIDAYKNKIEELKGSNNKRKAKVKDTNQLIHNVSEAINNFQKAIELDPDNALYHLGLASLLEQYVNYLKEINLKEVPEEIMDIISNRAIDIYFQAYELSITDDLKPDRIIPFVGFRGVVSCEAGNAYIRLVGMQESISETQKAKLSEVQQKLAKGMRQNLGAITPIIFTLDNIISPLDTLEHNLQVNFDLDGNGTNELWPWVKPSTGILVWNEDGKGKITSGRQLFGSVTWWLFFNNGYQALDCLDDSRDGSLSGDELKGISVWFDTNSNGKSESDEIKSLDELGIISISTKTTSTENGWPANKTGITLKSGQTIPTYDWIAKPISNDKL